MKAMSDTDWGALKRDIESLASLHRMKLTRRERNALLRLGRLKRKMDRKDKAREGLKES